MLVAFGGLAEVLSLDRHHQRREQFINGCIIFSAYFDEFRLHQVGQALALLNGDRSIASQILFVAYQNDRRSVRIEKRLVNAIGGRGIFTVLT